MIDIHKLIENTRERIRKIKTNSKEYKKRYYESANKKARERLKNDPEYRKKVHEKDRIRDLIRNHTPERRAQDAARKRRYYQERKRRNSIQESTD